MENLISKNKRPENFLLSFLSKNTNHLGLEETFKNQMIFFKNYNSAENFLLSERFAFRKCKMQKGNFIVFFYPNANKSFERNAYFFEKKLLYKETYFFLKRNHICFSFFLCCSARFFKSKKNL